MPAKLAPEYVRTIYGRERVQQTTAYPPGQHPAHCPIRNDRFAVELKTESGSRWYGFESAHIGSDLRMHCEGYSPRFEEVNAWEDADGV